MAANQTPTVPESFSAIPDWMRSLAKSLNLVLKGRLNVQASLTLTAGVTSTTLSDNRIGPFTVAHIEPVTLNAAGALGTTFQESKPNATLGRIVFTHVNTGTVDRTFIVSLIG